MTNSCVGFKLVLDCAKKYLTYPELTLDFTYKKKPSFYENENVCIAGIDEFVVKNPIYKKFVERSQNDTSWECEYVFFVKAKGNSTKPIDLPHFAGQEKVYIIIEDHAQVIINDIGYNKGDYLRYVPLFIGNNARLQYHYNQQTKKCNAFYRIDCFLQKDSYCSFMPIIKEVDFTQFSLNVYLQKAGANVDIAGYYWLKKKQQCVLDILQHHQAPNTKSNLAINGILFDAAQAVYNGTIFIDENAYNSNAEQSNKNILMGSKARVVSIPNLEVKTNEVQCKHGSAVGKLDLDQLFYMQSRGISLDKAKNMLLESFIYEPFKIIDENLMRVKKVI